eukprot:3912099-Amphidinium_carterae.1
MRRVTHVLLLVSFGIFALINVVVNLAAFCPNLEWINLLGKLGRKKQLCIGNGLLRDSNLSSDTS